MIGSTDPLQEKKNGVSLDISKPSLVGLISAHVQFSSDSHMQIIKGAEVVGYGPTDDEGGKFSFTPRFHVSYPCGFHR